MGACKKLVAADLFCGGGGTSKGLGLACEEAGIRNVRLIAINHWKIAIDTHSRNHPWAEHHCARVDQLDPRKLVPEGRLNILVASPECTNHANARGGRPINDQSRATAWYILKWLQERYIENVLIENIREIMDWGPLGANNRPLKSKKGEIFRAWVEAIRRCGYQVDHRILNAADFGDATTRRRFFLLARRGNRKIAWPEPTHAKDADRTGDLFKGLKPWRSAREIIDWSVKGESIFNRDKPLAKNTLRRIEAGLRKFGGPAAEPFLVVLRGTEGRQVEASPRSLEEPLPSISAGGVHAALVEPEPFVVGLEQTGSNGRQVRIVAEPIPSVTTRGRIGLVEPRAFVLQQQSGGAPRGVDQPLPTIAARGAQALVEPRAFIVPNFGERDGQAPRTHSIDDPLPSVTSHGAGSLVRPVIVQVNHGGGPAGRVQSVDEPLRTISTKNGYAVAVPSFLVKYFGTGRPKSVEDPLPTVTSKDRLGLVEPKAQGDGETVVLVDILFRMLQPRELARAMGFEGYEFTGSHADQVKMIGNAVCVNTAKALVGALLRP